MNTPHDHTPAVYSFERHQWNPQCPHGDICTGCDARGYCTRMERDGEAVTEEEAVRRTFAKHGMA